MKFFKKMKHTFPLILWILIWIKYLNMKNSHYKLVKGLYLSEKKE